MKLPQIAMIDLSSYTLSQPYKVLSAAKVLKDLKRDGEATWARRYKASTGTNLLYVAIISHQLTMA